MTPPASNEPTFLKALAKNAFFRDQTGQAMVEMVIVGPFLMFVLISTMYYYGFLDAQQDYLIARSEEVWTPMYRGFDGMNPQQRPNLAASDGDGFGFITNNMRLNMQILTAASILTEGNTEALPLGLATANLFTPIGGILTRFGEPTFYMPAQRPYALTDTPTEPFTAPYLIMGLPVMNYHTARPQNRTYTNPWRGFAMGMASTFGTMRGNSTTATNENLPQTMDLGDRERFALVHDTWHAGFNMKTGQRRSFRDTRMQISMRAGGATVWNNATGTAVQALIGICALSIPMPDFLVHTLTPNSVDGNTVLDIMTMASRDWTGITANNIVFGSGFKRKIDNRLQTTSNGQNSLQSISGAQADQMWK